MDKEQRERLSKIYSRIDNNSGTDRVDKAVEECRALLDAGVDVNANPDNDDEWKLLHLAAYQCSVKFCQLLLDYGADPNDCYGGTTPLHEAARWAGVGACRVLVKGGADPSYVPPNPRHGYLTPFQEVVVGTEYDHEMMIRLFVMEFAVDLEQKTVNGRTLMDLVSDRPDVQELLRSLALERAIASGFDAVAGDSASAGSPRSSGVPSL